jgi:hypothetical protein
MQKTDQLLCSMLLTTSTFVFVVIQFAFSTSFPHHSSTTMASRFAKTARLNGSTSVAAARTALDENSTTGEFKRVEAAWRNWIRKGTKTLQKHLVRELYCQHGFVCG